MANHDKIRDDLARLIQTDGQRLKLDLMKLLRFVVKTEGWKQFDDPATGRPFADLRTFLRAQYPSGVGCGQFDGMLTYGDVCHLCRGDSGLLTALLQGVEQL